jgi:hypothetical protein
MEVRLSGIDHREPTHPLRPLDDLGTKRMGGHPPLSEQDGRRERKRFILRFPLTTDD